MLNLRGRKAGCAMAVAGAVTAWLALESVGAAEPPPSRLDVQAPGGIVFTVTADGLSSIRQGEREVATGGWYAWNAGPVWFGRGAKGALSYGYYSKSVYPQAAKDLREKSIEILAPDRARVRHLTANSVATFDYQFAGEDVTISVRLENNHPTAEMTVPAFGGLAFHFAKVPAGIMPVWHPSYLTANMSGVFHPSHLTKIGGSYATDGAIGVGLTPLRTGLARTLFFWDYADPDAGRQAQDPVRWLTYLRPEPIPPGGALTFVMRMRVSRNTEWKHLLAPYKEHFTDTFGPVQYKCDYRAMGVAHVNRDRASISPENPYGFHGGRRLDLPEGIAAFCDMVIPGLQQADGQGLIIWGQTGEEPRDQMYRADFDVLPPAVAENWDTLRRRFADAGLRLGVCTRPRHLHVRLDWQTDGTLDINANDPQHLEVQVWNRFKHMIDRGCTLFYLDSFGNSLEDVKVMRYLREKMGPEIVTFTEHQCDVMAVYSAFYSETDFWEKGAAAWVPESNWYPRAGSDFLEKVNWLVGLRVPVISRGYDVHGTVPPELRSTNAFFYGHRMTPMIEDYQIQANAPEIRRLQEQYLTPEGSWR